MGRHACASSTSTPHGDLIDEYRTPLEAGGKPFGTLVYGVAQPGLWTYVSQRRQSCAAGDPRPGVLHGRRRRAAQSHGPARRRHRAAALPRGDERVGRRLRADARRRHRRRRDGLESRRQPTRRWQSHQRAGSADPAVAREGPAGPTRRRAQQHPRRRRHDRRHRPAHVHQSPDGRDPGHERHRRRDRRQLRRRAARRR